MLTFVDGTHWGDSLMQNHGANYSPFLNTQCPTTQKTWMIQWIILVLVIGGRDYITPQKAIFTWYISLYTANLVITYYLPPFTRT